MFMLTSTHRDRLKAEHEELLSERAERRRLGRLAAELMAERDEARARVGDALAKNAALHEQLQPFLDRQERAKQNLRQFKRETA